MKLVRRQVLAEPADGNVMLIKKVQLWVVH